MEFICSVYITNKKNKDNFNETTIFFLTIKTNDLGKPILFNCFKIIVQVNYNFYSLTDINCT